MDSQRDMFYSEPPMFVEDNEEGHEDRRTSSCPPSISFEYGFVILFNWNEGLKKPFKCYSRNLFKEDITDCCMTKKLTQAYRIKKMKPLKPLLGLRMSLFAKVQSCKYILILFGAPNRKVFK